MPSSSGYLDYTNMKRTDIIHRLPYSLAQMMAMLMMIVYKECVPSLCCRYFRRKHSPCLSLSFSAPFLSFSRCCCCCWSLCFSFNIIFICVCISIVLPISHSIHIFCHSCALSLFLCRSLSFAHTAICSVADFQCVPVRHIYV